MGKKAFVWRESTEKKKLRYKRYFYDMRTKKGRQQKKFLHSSSSYKRKAPFCSSISSSERKREREVINCPLPFLLLLHHRNCCRYTQVIEPSWLDLYAEKGGRPPARSASISRICALGRIANTKRESSHEYLPLIWVNRKEWLILWWGEDKISLSLFRLCLSCLDAKCVWPTDRTRGRRLLGTGLGGRQDIRQILDDLCFKFSLVDISSKKLGEWRSLFGEFYTKTSAFFFLPFPRETWNKGPCL